MRQRARGSRSRGCAGGEAGKVAAGQVDVDRVQGACRGVVPEVEDIPAGRGTGVVDAGASDEKPGERGEVGPRCRVPRGDGADSLEGRDTEGRHVIGERNALEVRVGLEGVGLIAPVERMEAPADGLVGVLGGLVVGEDRGGAVIGRAVASAMVRTLARDLHRCQLQGTHVASRRARAVIPLRARPHLNRR